MVFASEVMHLEMTHDYMILLIVT